VPSRWAAYIPALKGRGFTPHLVKQKLPREVGWSRRSIRGPCTPAASEIGSRKSLYSMLSPAITYRFPVRPHSSASPCPSATSSTSTMLIPARRALGVRHGGPGRRSERNALRTLQFAPRRQARAHGQHDQRIARLLRRRHDEQSRNSRPIHVSDAYRRLLDLLRSGLLDIRPIRPRVFPLAALPEAMEAAAVAGNLECIVVQP
jgi:hypothetical protein